MIKQNFLFKQAQTLLGLSTLSVMAQLPKDFLFSGALISPRPGWFWIAGGGWRWRASPSSSQLSFFAPDFFLSRPDSWLIPSEVCEVSAHELFELLLDHAASRTTVTDEGVFASKEAPSRLLWAQPNPSEFEKSFLDLHEQFQRGSLKKAVPVTFERARCKVSPEWICHSLLNLLKQLSMNLGNLGNLGSEKAGGVGKNLRIYGIWGIPGIPGKQENEGMLGATPEDLFEITPQGDVLTMAVAGTRSKTSDSDQDSLLNDPKERIEHQWVIDDIREALSDLGELEVRETQVVELPTLLHLKTRIELREPRYSSQDFFGELVRRLHPTAALGAFPRVQGWEWLRSQNEASQRNRFGAPFGASWPGKGALCAVAIRNVQWTSHELWLGSGCGVIRESVLDHEWQELHLKRQSIKRLLGL